VKDIRICYVGDSFVNGTGDPDKLGWTGRLSRCAESDGAEITHYNLGIRRETSGDILQRWAKECRARLPEVSDNRVVFSFGVNDAVVEEGTPRVGVETSVANARAILTEALSFYSVIMVGPPPIDDEMLNKTIRELDEKYADLCRELKVPYLSVFDRLAGDALWQREVSSNDGAHPRSEGYALLADYIRGWEGWWFRNPEA